MKMQKLLFCFFLFDLSFFASQKLAAQLGYKPINGARSVGLANSGLFYRDIQAVFHNPAGLAFLKEKSILVTAEVRGLDTDLKAFALAFGLPTTSGTFTLNVQHRGSKNFQEEKMGLGYARRFSEKISAGAQFDWLLVRVPDYGQKNILTFELGFNALISKDLELGFHLYNPVLANVSESENVPAVFVLGLIYTLNPKVKMSLEAEKNIISPLNLRMAFEYFPVQNVTLRMGYALEPSIWSFGLGYALEHFQIGIGTQGHPRLGILSAADLAFSF
jgi:hypothetical protein